MWKPLDCNVALAGIMALAISFAASPVLAQEAAEASQPQVTVQTREPTVLVCKVFAPTGSRIVQEYCLTEDDWDDIRENSRVALERLMRTGTEI